MEDHEKLLWGSEKLTTIVITWQQSQTTGQLLRHLLRARGSDQVGAPFCLVVHDRHHWRRARAVLWSRGM